MVYPLCINHLITSIDQFGQGIELRIDKLVKSKTFFGGLLTILMQILLFLMFYFSAQDIFYHTNPRISIEQKINQELPEILMDRFSFPISFSLTYNGNFALYKPKYFNYYISLRYGETTAEKLKEEFLNFTNCKKEFFPLVTQQAYDKLNMDQNLCVPGQNISMSGGWRSHYINYMSLRISICTGEPHCAPYDEIVDYLKTNTFFWNIYYMHTNVNPQNFTSPIAYNIFNYYKLIKLGSYKMTEIYIRSQTLRSDDGFMFQTYKYIDTLAFDYDVNDDSAINDTFTLVDFQFYVSPNTFIYHRKYMKIQEVLANVGGLANLLKILFVLSCYIFSVVKRDEIILNKIFEFDLRHQGINQDNNSSKYMNRLKKIIKPTLDVNKPKLYHDETFNSSVSTKKNKNCKNDKFEHEIINNKSKIFKFLINNH
jgi:hypothetical protein